MLGVAMFSTTPVGCAASPPPAGACTTQLRTRQTAGIPRHKFVYYVWLGLKEGSQTWQANQ